MLLLYIYIYITDVTYTGILQDQEPLCALNLIKTLWFTLSSKMNIARHWLRKGMNSSEFSNSGFEGEASTQNTSLEELQV